MIISENANGAQFSTVEPENPLIEYEDRSLGLKRATEFEAAAGSIFSSLPEAQRAAAIHGYVARKLEDQGRCWDFELDADQVDA